MTITETRPSSEEVVLPEGIQINSEALQALSSLSVRAGQVLIGRLDPEVINAYPRESPEAGIIASAISNLARGLSRDQRLTYAPIPGEAPQIGLWIAPYVNERSE